MELNEFIQLIETQESCPESWSGPLQALWHDRKGDWDKAHQIVQDASDPDSKRVHAYLHRKQGDLGNARYWYKRSRQPEFQGELNQEWEQIATDLLAVDERGRVSPADCNHNHSDPHFSTVLKPD